MKSKKERPRKNKSTGSGVTSNFQNCTITNAPTLTSNAATGQYLTTSNSGVLSFTTASSSSATMDITGDLVVSGNIVQGGTIQHQMDKRMERIERLLGLPGIININKELEDKFKDLQDLHDQYRELETKLITWENMKKKA